MEYRFYKQTPDGYQLKKPYGSVIFTSVVFLLIAALFTWYAGKTGDNKYYLYTLGLLIVTVIPYLVRRVHRVVISPTRKTVTVGLNKGKSYPFSDFLNFLATNQNVNGILVQRKVSMYFNDNGKNRMVLLGIVTSKKKVNQLIEETQSLMQ